MKLKNFFSKAKDGIKSLFKGKRKFATIAVILVVAIVFGYVGIFEKKRNSEEKSRYTVAQAKKGDITETIEQSGVVEPYERRGLQCEL